MDSFRRTARVRELAGVIACSGKSKAGKPSQAVDLLSSNRTVMFQCEVSGDVLNCLEYLTLLEPSLEEFDAYNVKLMNLLISLFKELKAAKANSSIALELVHSVNSMCLAFISTMSRLYQKYNDKHKTITKIFPNLIKLLVKDSLGNWANAMLPVNLNNRNFRLALSSHCKLVGEIPRLFSGMCKGFEGSIRQFYSEFIEKTQPRSVILMGASEDSLVRTVNLMYCNWLIYPYSDPQERFNLLVEDSLQLVQAVMQSSRPKTSSEIVEEKTSGSSSLEGCLYSLECLYGRILIGLQVMLARNEPFRVNFPRMLAMLALCLTTLDSRVIPISLSIEEYKSLCLFANSRKMQLLEFIIRHFSSDIVEFIRDISALLQEVLNNMIRRQSEIPLRPTLSLFGTAVKYVGVYLVEFIGELFYKFISNRILVCFVAVLSEEPPRGEKPDNAIYSALAVTQEEEITYYLKFLVSAIDQRIVNYTEPRLLIDIHGLLQFIIPSSDYSLEDPIAEWISNLANSMCALCLSQPSDLPLCLKAQVIASARASRNFIKNTDSMLSTRMGRGKEPRFDFTPINWEREFEILMGIGREKLQVQAATRLEVKPTTKKHTTVNSPRQRQFQSGNLEAKKDQRLGERNGDKLLGVKRKPDTRKAYDRPTLTKVEIKVSEVSDEDLFSLKDSQSEESLDVPEIV